MFKKLEDVENRYDDLTAQLSDPAVISNQAVYQKTAKEHSSIAELVVVYRQHKKIEQERLDRTFRIRPAEIE